MCLDLASIDLREDSGSRDLLSHQLSATSHSLGEVLALVGERGVCVYDLSLDIYVSVSESTVITSSDRVVDSLSSLHDVRVVPWDQNLSAHVSGLVRLLLDQFIAILGVLQEYFVSDLGQLDQVGNDE